MRRSRIIVVYSFNSGRYAMDWQGFSTEWYGKALSNPLIVEALITSVIIAGDDGAALGRHRHTGGARPAARLAASGAMSSTA